MEKRSLWQCEQARVLGDGTPRGTKVYCTEGHRLHRTSRDGSLHYHPVMRGKPLEFEICQGCLGYIENGPPIPQNERGWVTTVV